MINWLTKKSKKDLQNKVRDIGNGDGKIILWKSISTNFGIPSLEIEAIKYNNWEEGENNPEIRVYIRHIEDSGLGYSIDYSNKWKKELKILLRQQLKKSYNHLLKQIDRL